MEETLPPRITGTEMEWSITALYMDRGKADDSYQMGSHQAWRCVMRYLKRHLAYVGKDYDYFLANGARLYVDVGEHVEYATPEDSTFMGTVANEIAGEQLMRNILEAGADRRNGPSKEFSLNKRVIDDKGTVWGYHESYASSTPLFAINEGALALLGVHLATRSIFTGAGVLRADGRYHVAQKAGRVTHDFSTGTTRNSIPVVNLRNEPLTAHHDLSKRIHVTSGDANMSPWATFMKLGTTSLVLRLIESGRDMEWLRLKNSLSTTAITVATDTSARNLLELSSGKRLYAHEVQEALLQETRLLQKQCQLPDEEEIVLTEWQKAVDDTARDPMLLADRADWVAKLQRLSRYRERHGLKWKDEQLRRKDRQWDNIGAKGAGLAMRQTVWRDWMPGQALIDARMATPPPDTRAAVRGRFIDHFSGYPDIYASWDELKFRELSYQLPDPYANSHEHIDKFIAVVPKKNNVAAGPAPK